MTRPSNPNTSWKRVLVKHISLLLLVTVGRARDATMATADPIEPEKVNVWRVPATEENETRFGGKGSLERPPNRDLAVTDHSHTEMHSHLYYDMSKNSRNISEDFTSSLHVWDLLNTSTAGPFVDFKQNKTQQIRLDNTPNDAPATPATPEPSWFECTFGWLDCGLVSNDFDEWKRHCLSHFYPEEPGPCTFQCPSCAYRGGPYANGLEAWELRLNHMAAVHYRQGHDVSMIRPDFELIDYMWSKRLIDNRLYMQLKSSARLGNQITDRNERRRRGRQRSTLVTTKAATTHAETYKIVPITATAVGTRQKSPGGEAASSSQRASSRISTAESLEAAALATPTTDPGLNSNMPLERTVKIDFVHRSVADYLKDGAMGGQQQVRSKPAHPYRCPVPTCAHAHWEFEDVENFRYHMRNAHGDLLNHKTAFVCAAKGCAMGGEMVFGPEKFRQHCTRMHGLDDLDMLMRSSARDIETLVGPAPSGRTTGSDVKDESGENDDNGFRLSSALSSRSGPIASVDGAASHPPLEQGLGTPDGSSRLQTWLSDGATESIEFDPMWGRIPGFTAVGLISSRTRSGEVSVVEPDDASDAMSVVSNAGDSIASVISNVSSYTSIDRPDLIDVCLQHLASHPRVSKAALHATKLFSKDRFERNLARLLKFFARSLKLQAKDNVELQAAGFLRRRTGYAASFLTNRFFEGREKLTTRRKGSTLASTRLENATNDSDDSDHELEPDENPSMSSEQIKCFLTGCQSFDDFVLDLDILVGIVPPIRVANTYMGPVHTVLDALILLISSAIPWTTRRLSYIERQGLKPGASFAWRYEGLTSGEWADGRSWIEIARGPFSTVSVERLMYSTATQTLDTVAPQRLIKLEYRFSSLFGRCVNLVSYSQDTPDLRAKVHRATLAPVPSVSSQTLDWLKFDMRRSDQIHQPWLRISPRRKNITWRKNVELVAKMYIHQRYLPSAITSNVLRSFLQQVAPLRQKLVTQILDSPASGDMIRSRTSLPNLTSRSRASYSDDGGSVDLPKKLKHGKLASQNWPPLPSQWSETPLLAPHISDMMIALATFAWFASFSKPNETSTTPSPKQRKGSRSLPQSYSSFTQSLSRAEPMHSTADSEESENREEDVNANSAIDKAVRPSVSQTQHGSAGLNLLHKHAVENARTERSPDRRRSPHVSHQMERRKLLGKLIAVIPGLSGKNSERHILNQSRPIP